jgi:hypothetical protein
MALRLRSSKELMVQALRKLPELTELSLRISRLDLMAP